jgi:EAL domain-containing protein (putative c-di-GMP-specific phosphodiesterase class I)
MERRSPTPGATRKREAVRRLKTGLEEDRFVLHYQPIVGVLDGRVVALEALLRWRDRVSADVDDLIWSAERSPIIGKLENWTLRHACEDASEWQKAGPGGCRVNVNLSARQFARADLIEHINQQLGSCRLDPRALALEITETSRIRDFDAVAGQIEKLNAIGVELWLDDFGTGHSSLEWLSRLPCHGVKIPRVFVEKALTEKRSKTIVARVVELAHDLELRVVAEGVETPAQRDLIAALGCDLFQGYLFHAPMAALDLACALQPPGPVSDTLPA